ncbi:hypothetical protein C5B85_09695 [Pseudoclavibacter sp. AY1F1]|uniref:hypothetical protein n=1 Tax=Pseudoclavibacter sp. AY1F1 TaxID=2080583 RepID=UPI000CE8139C|nr:hypothetical protein [Pseudoclavibacter sp. AY1F1]PPF44418.1 hypothetical protein C5B85_09695 [Pseudoclavibacter sp. AY1F1]
MSIALTVNQDRFVLHDAEAISRLHGDIRDAVRAGGNLVTVGSRPDSPEVLITPATPVRIDILEVREDAGQVGRPGGAQERDGTDSGDVVFIDFDQY